MLEAFLRNGTYLLLKMLGVVVFSPVFLIPSVLLAIGGSFLGSVLVRGQLAMKREMNKAMAPVVGHFSTMVSGIGKR